MKLTNILLVGLLSWFVSTHPGYTDDASSGVTDRIPSQTNPTVLKDEHGRVIRVDSGGDISGLQYDGSGALQAITNSRFGRTEYSYVPGKSSGPFARVQSIRQVSSRGTWERALFYDQEGAVALKTEGVKPDFLRTILQNLQPYFWPSGLRSLTPRSVGPVEGEDFASISVVYDTDGGEVQNTTVFGHNLEVSTRPLEDGKLRIWDSQGAERFETWSEGSLLSAYDQTGSILKAKLDAHGRPESIVVGGSIMLRFDYEDGERLWVRRHLIDLEAGQSLNSWKRADEFENLEQAALPRQGALAFLPGSVPIAEWDAEYSPGGSIVISRKGVPYALIPFDSKEGEAWHSISTSFDDVPAQDRIDYTDSHIRLHLALGSASIAAGTEAILVIERERNLDHSESGKSELSK